MKKILIVLILLCLTAFSFTSCTGEPTVNRTPAQPELPDQTAPTNPSEGENPEKEVITKMFVTVNGNKLEATLAENSSAAALAEALKQGDITFTATDYGDFEKVGDIGFTLPQNDTQITTQAVDIILYQGHNICLYYGANSWNFTRIGKINGYSAAELRTLLGAGNGSVQVTLSLK